MDYIVGLFTFLRVSPDYITLLSGIATLFLFVLLLFLAGLFFKTISTKYFHSSHFHLKNKKWQEAVKETNILAIAGYLGAGFIAKISEGLFFPTDYTTFHTIALKIITAYFQLCILLFINNALNVIIIVNRNNPNLPIKGLMQFAKIFLNFFGGLIILAYFIGKEPMYFISALGVIASILMIVFKDTILGLTASWQLAMNNMLNIGDWIVMPKHNADGNVIDISLTTVSVQNWDNTIITIPAYDLIANSFQNWKGMSQSGGRRIKRAIYIDMESIKFVDEEMSKRFQKIELLKDYTGKRLLEINDYNSKHDTSGSALNARHMTNIGTFRIYCEEYIKSRPYINTKFTTLVRQLDISPQGLPIEIYCFTSTTEWVAYERYQADIFDHLLSILKEFDLYVFQNPSGRDFSLAVRK
jgi:miniconductance mechanosensitive channel